MKVQTLNGLPVKNAPPKAKLTIKISAADVKRGNVKDPGGCAAALACLHIPGVKAARFHLSRAYVLIGRKWIRYQVPPSLRQEIVTFDRGGSFEPGKHVLTGMRPSAAARGERQGSKTGANNRHKHKKRGYQYAANVRQFGANR